MSDQKPVTDRQIAVLIDFENVGLNSIQGLFDQTSDIGRIIVKRAYADWSAASGSRDQLLKLGIDPIHLFRSTSGGKNASDIRLAIDAIDLLHSSPVDTFVIVSADTDFVPLISRLRAAGKYVIGAGEHAKATSTLVTSCDRYIYLGQDKSIESSKVPVSDEGREHQELIQRAVRASVDEHGTVPGSKLHQTMQRLDPSFDYRSAGFSTFTKFLIRHLKNIPDMRVVRPRGPGDVMVKIIEKSER